MKYRTFVRLRAGAGAAAAALLVWAGCRATRNDGEPVVPPQAMAGRTQEPPPRSQGAPPASAPVGGEAMGTVQRTALQMLGEPLSQGTSDGKSLKWRMKRGREVIELRCDQNKGATTWNRVKIDLDGDKRFDELWDIKDGEIRRKVAPADDENYTRTFRYEGDAWAPA